MIADFEQALNCAADWHELLKVMTLAAAQVEGGNRIVQDRIESASGDRLLKRCPPLHATHIIYQLDCSFGAKPPTVSRTTSNPS